MLQESSIYKDGRTSSHPGFGPVPNILADPRQYFRIVLIFLKLLFIQSQLSGDFLNFLITKSVEIIEKLVVELPEPPLPVSSNGGYSGLPGNL